MDMIIMQYFSRLISIEILASISPTARRSFDSRRRVGGKENLEFHTSVLQYFLEKFLCPS